MTVFARVVVMGALSVFVANVAIAATPDQISQSRNKGLAWLFTHQAGDGSWTNSAGLKIQPTSAAIDAFLNAGIKQGFPFAAGVAWLGNAETLSVDSLARQTRTLYRCGENTDAFITKLNDKVHFNSKSWGAYANYYGSFPDTSLAVDAIVTTNTSIISYLSTSASFITSKQITSNSGWAYTPQEAVTSQNRLIPTAYNLIALSHYKSKSSGVDANITRAVAWLLTQQKPDGGFADSPNDTAVNVHETALACLAINEARLAGNAVAGTAGATVASAQDFLVRHQQADGSWGSDPFQTALALQAFPAAQLADGDKDGLPDVVEAILDTNPLVADARSYLKNSSSPKIIVTPTADSFGNLYANNSATRSYVITNTGTVPLAIGRIYLAGDQGFNKTDDTCSATNISPSATCTVQIGFTPQTAGLATANLIIPSNDLDSATTFVALNGIGSLPVLNLAFAGTGGGTISASPNNVACSSPCTYSYPMGTSISVLPTPNAISSFAGWSGGGCGASSSCAFSLSADTTVTANFIYFADFSFSPTGGFAPLTVRFTGLDPSATGWTWDFGDGTTSTEQNPSHLYRKPGTYTVTLTATSSQRSASFSRKVSVSDLTPILMLLLD